MCQGIIYKATNQINGKCYIGQTINKLNERKNSHISVSKNKTTIYFYNAINKYGKDNFQWEVIYECDEVMLDMMETFKIMVNKSHYTEGGYNLTWGGKSKRGYKISEETKRKIREGNKGKIRSEETRLNMSKAQKGRIVSEKTKKKISESRKGIIFNEEHKRKLSKANMCHSVSEETRLNMSKAQKGRKHSEETKKKMSKAQRGRKLTEETKRKMSEAHMRIDKINKM